MSNIILKKIFFFFLFGCLFFFGFIAITNASSKSITQENFSGPKKVNDSNCEKDPLNLGCRNGFTYEEEKERKDCLL